MKIESFGQILEKNHQIPNFVKIHPVGAELCHANGWTHSRMDRYEDFFFNVLLTVHLSTFILVINQLDAQNFVLQ